MARTKHATEKETGMTAYIQGLGLHPENNSQGRHNGRVVTNPLIKGGAAPSGTTSPKSLTITNLNQSADGNLLLSEVH